MEEFGIILNKPNKIYFPGEELGGMLKIRCKERVKINSVTVIILGEGSVYWSERETVRKTSRVNRDRNIRSHRTHGKIIKYRNNEIYINLNLILASKQSGTDLYLETGEQIYPFKIILPANLPTSFEHRIGKIRYTIKACIDIPWAFDKKTSIYFSVVNGLDLNLFPNLRVALTGSEEKFFCCGPCRSEPITALLNIPKTGFVPGERINFRASLDNKSGREIKELSIILVQRVTFHAKGKSKTLTSNVTKILFPKEIKGKSVENWNDGILVIPPICPSTNGSCRIIDVDYEIVMYFGTSGLTLGSKVILPIIIGTIPIISEENMHLAKNSFTLMASDLKVEPNEKVEVEETQNPDEIDFNSEKFMPFYPYYKDFSVQMSHSNTTKY